jgi:myo-inositol 2-dehydrogenase/D-chiro-inositol 1-dehydrogenase
MTGAGAGGAESGRVRLGVVGLGAVAQAVHLPIVERLGDRFELAAICDLSPGILATVGDRYRVPASAHFTESEAMLSGGGVDAVAILTSGSHGGPALAALQSGWPTFVEKPLAFTLAEADAVAAARGADRVLVGYMKLWDPAVRRALAAVQEARARGVALRAIEVTILHPTSERQLWQARVLPPPGDIPAAVTSRLTAEADRLLDTALGQEAAALGPLYTGILLGSLVHDLALIRAFDGDPIAIDNVDVWPADRWPPSVAVAGRLDSGARLAIGWHYLPDYAAYREIVRVILDDITVELEFPSPYLLHAPTRLTITQPDGEARRDTTTTSVAEAFEEELLAFHRLVVEGAQPYAGVAAGRADIVTCQRIVRRLAESRGMPIGGEAARQQDP